MSLTLKIYLINVTVTLIVEGLILFFAYLENSSSFKISQNVENILKLGFVISGLILIVNLFCLIWIG